MPHRKSLLIQVCSTFLFLILTPWSFCQVLDGTPDTAKQQEPEADNSLTHYKQLKEEYRKKEKKINELYSNLNLGSQETRAEQFKEINALQVELDRARVEMFEAALAAAREIDDLERAPMYEVMEYAKSSYGGSRHSIPFDPAKTIEICEVLRQRGVLESKLFQLEVNASLASLNFENVRKRINDAAQKGATLPQPFIDGVNAAEEKWTREKKLRTEEKDLPTIRMETTQGDITFVLFEDEAPEAVRNFVSLIDSEFYDGLDFFQVKRGQMVRSGCPQNDGNSVPAYSVASEAENDNARHHFAGSLSMLTDTNKNSCCSQFIISQRPLPHLDNNFTVIGRVIEGMDVLDNIIQVTNSSIQRGESKPKIQLIEVLSRRSGTTYIPNKLDEN
ncbi:peptidylprolyl isomerase [bacterium]|nr:peptidylprolyl isomerase [bacterium]